jgi:nucleoid-associated protein YgaU
MGLGINNLGITFQAGTATVTGEAHTQSDREKIVLTVGNVAGVHSVDDQMTVIPQPAPEPEADFYTVESGDSLSKIAKQFYGDANKYMYIFEENKPMLGDPDEIYPGQVLRIPRI